MVAWVIDPFFSAKLRIERAKEHLDTLDTEFDRFFDKNPGEYVAEPNADGVHIIHKIKFRERFPIKWRVIATEVIEHLRASLDQATYATFFLATGQPDTNFAAFPFGKTPTDLDNGIKGRSKDLRPEIQTLLRTLNTYKGGNDLLYTLNELANNCKHGLVAFIVGAVAKYEIRAKRIEGVEIAEPILWDAEKNEIAYARVKAGTIFEHQGKVGVFVAMPDVEHLPGDSSAIIVLDNIGKEVVRVVDAIEAESRRIGILN